MADALVKEASQHPFWVLNQRQLHDIELILNRSFAPLNSFMGKQDYDSVVHNMRLADGTLFPIPVTLDIPPRLAEIISVGKKITLRDAELFNIAVMTITDIWEPDLMLEAEAVYRTTDDQHPAVNYLLHESNSVYISGTLQSITPMRHHSFQYLHHTPAQIKEIFKQKNWRCIAAFQTRNPLHRAHLELTLHVLREHDVKLLLHPVTGPTKPGDIDYYVRVRCYKEIMRHYPKNSAILSLLPLAMRLGGPREALWHGIIRKNFGCSHLIIGRDHAGPGHNSQNQDFYGEFEAQELFAQHQEEIGIKMVPVEKLAYSMQKKTYVFTRQKSAEEDTAYISGTKLRTMLANNDSIPEWFSFPEIIAELKKAYLPLHKRGFTVFFTGLSGAGKSTIAHILVSKLKELEHFNVTLLDGDIARHHLSSELGFSKEHRSINVRRIGYVASEITKSNGIAVCALIAPYAEDRLANRKLISEYGGYIEVYVNTPLSVCEERDVKGLYLSARENLTRHFTGISDIYEVPENPEVTIETESTATSEAIAIIIKKIQSMGYLKFVNESTPRTL